VYMGRRSAPQESVDLGRFGGREELASAGTKCTREYPDEEF
jgi:hypothetical protein